MPPNPQAATVPTAYSAVVIPRSLRRRTVRTLDMEPPGAGNRPVRAPPPRGCVPGCSAGAADPMGDVPAGDEGLITAVAVDGGGRRRRAGRGAARGVGARAADHLSPEP